MKVAPNQSKVPHDINLIYLANKIGLNSKPSGYATLPKIEIPDPAYYIHVCEVSRIMQVK